MKKGFLLVIVALVTCLPLWSKVIFVKPGSNGDGSSWNSALGNLQDALRQATEGDEIWVARGIYHPTQDTDRTATFHIPSGVQLLGGFAGHETSAQQRDFTLNRTVLSGEIGSPDSDADNSYTVVLFLNASPQTVLDGFEISGGNANNPTEGVNPSNCGGAIFNNASDGFSAPVISNCLIKRNRAFYGGGIYNYALKGDCSLTKILKCEFLENDARLEGGAIYNLSSDNGRCNLIMRNCNFEDNQAFYGAGIFNYADKNGQTNPVVEDCTFTANGAGIRASGIYNLRGDSGECVPSLVNCHFGDTNSEMVGGNIGGNAGNGEAKKPRQPIIIRTTTPSHTTISTNSSSGY